MMVHGSKLTYKNYMYNKRHPHPDTHFSLFTPQLTIVVEDVNDNAPVFQQSQYNMYTRNNARAGTALGKVVAKDADVVTSGTITYSIAMGNTDGMVTV